MGLGRLAERLASGAFTAFLLSALIFLATSLLPGDAATTILGENATPEALERIRSQLGLDRPIWAQYLGWLGGAVRCDFGLSTTLNRPVAGLIATNLGASLILAGIALSAAAIISIPFGVWAAARQGGRVDGAILTASYVGVSVPDFVTGPLLIMALAGPPLALLPSNGFVPLSESVRGFASHLILPSLTLVFVLVAHLVRQTRAGMLEVLASDYVRTARLKGLPERRVLFRHVLPNGLTATVAVLALDIGYLLGSIVVVEEIFAYPGIGRLMIYAVANRDIPLVQGTTLVIGLAYITANLTADLAQGLLDPRVRK